MWKEALENYLYWKSATEPRAAQNYRPCIKKFFEFSKKELGEVDFMDVAAFQHHLNKKSAPATVSLHVTALKSFFAWCNNRGVCTVRIQDIRNPKVPLKVPNYVAQKQYIDIVRSIKDQRKLLCIKLLWFTGLRVSELTALEWSQIDFKSFTANVMACKSFIPKVVSWDKETNDLLVEIMQNSDSGYVFANQRGDRITTRQIQRWLKEISQETKIKVTPHTFRHGCTKELLDQGTDITIIQQMLGHKNLVSLQKYSRRLSDDLKEHAMEAARRRSHSVRTGELVEFLDVKRNWG